MVKENYSFKIMNFLFEFFTYGYIPHILLFVASFTAVLMLIVLLTHLPVIYFHFKDRMKFVRRYFKLIILQKKNFIYSFWRISEFEIKKYSKILLILLGLGAIVFFVLFKFVFRFE